jgi:hypothetical protein
MPPKKYHVPDTLLFSLRGFGGPLETEKDLRRMTWPGHFALINALPECVLCLLSLRFLCI